MIKRLVAFAALFLAVSISLTLAGAASAASNNSPWGKDYFPNVPLVNQDGKTVRFYDDLLKDKKVMVDFIFVDCEQGCPLDTANMRRVQKLLGDRIGKDIFMYSITLEPEKDTPQRMKEYAEQYGAGPGWQFLTGTRENIDAVRYALGQRGVKEEHANAVQVGDMATGRWIRIPLAADPNYIVTETINSLYPGWSEGKKLKSYADAKSPPVFGVGQVIFANRCAACHTFGKGHDLGPDLADIAHRRERNWLVSYLAEPNLLRAKKDPIAMELARTNKVLMPNLKLTQKEVGDVLAYLEAMSVPAPKAEEKQAPVAANAAGAEKPAAAAHDHSQHDHANHDHAAGKK